MSTIEDNRKKYIEAKRNIEAEANRYTVIGLMCTCAVLFLSWIFTFIGYFQIDLTAMTITCGVCIGMFAIVALLSRFVPPGHSWVKYTTLSTICVAMGVIEAMFSYHVTVLTVLPLIFATQYGSKRTLWITYAVNLLCNVVATILSVRIGVLDINLFFEGLHTKGEFEKLFADGALTTNANIDLVILVYMAVPRAIMLGLLTVLINILTNRGRTAAVNLSKFKMMSETDYMTGLGNKAKYREWMETHYPEVDNIAVSYFDLNDLKKVNDEYGHSKGDALITIFSEILLKRCNNRTQAYRLGGDEFILVMEYPVQGEAKQVASEISAEFCEKLTTEDGWECENAKKAVAVGIAEGRGSQLKALVESADINMYVEKRKMKESGKI